MHVEPGFPSYAEVAIPLRVTQTFTYKLPSAIQQAASIGSRLIVPFGRKFLTGYIVALYQALDNGLELDPSSIKEAEELLDIEPLLTPEVLSITRWISDYYAAPWGEVLKAALPAGLNSSIDQMISITSTGRDELIRLSSKRVQTIKAQALRLISYEEEITLRTLSSHLGQQQASKAVRELERSGWIRVIQKIRSAQAKVKRRKVVRLIADQTISQSLSSFTTPQQRIIESLLEYGGEISYSELLELTGTSGSSIQTLERRGILQVFVQEVRRDPLANALLPDLQELRLTDSQEYALKEIEEALEHRRYAAFLLHGVTGSGKTEIYIRAMRAVLRKGCSAMMLVPEIALTPVFSRRLRAHFGDAVAIFHSSLSTGERFDEWTRLRRGEARVVIGTRSAVFAPVSNLGIVIVDEEHEASYRQQESPFYNGRDTAIMRALKEQAVVVLGSATPSLESFHNARKGRYRYLQLPGRVAGRAMAKAEIVNMCEVFSKSGKPEVFSDQLLTAIEETHARGEQTIILLNRRGYSSFILCRSCGERIECPHCDVALTFHRSERSLICHYCNFRRNVPSYCPTCKAQYIYYVGEGTEQIEEILKKRFPMLRIARLDRDTTVRKSAYEQTILQFGAGELDLLVGTQMIAKGHDFPNVTLVGVVSVDAGLGMPDFRAAERAFQLITQVAGRAGRGELAGRVLIQTYHPNHYALLHACQQDYESFYEEEISYRKSLSYPPFVALASILVHSEDYTRAQLTASHLKDALDKANKERLCRILGPAPAPLARLKGEHRIQLLLKSRNRPHMREVLDIALASVAEIKECDLRSVNIEIDPVSLI
jgi:primosomal protein N' (replication factor Y) (superfamily II helicase)